MKLLLDTHLILWTFGSPGSLSRRARALIEEPSNALFFSPISLYEVAVKNLQGRGELQAGAWLNRYPTNVLDAR